VILLFFTPIFSSTRLLFHWLPHAVPDRAFPLFGVSFRRSSRRALHVPSGFFMEPANALVPFVRRTLDKDRMGLSIGFYSLVGPAFLALDFLWATVFCRLTLLVAE